MPPLLQAAKNAVKTVGTYSGFNWFLSESTNDRVRHTLASGVLTVLALVLSAVLATRYIIPNVSYNVPLLGTPPPQQISIITNYLDIDATAGTLMADWYPKAVECPTPEAIVNFYFDPNLLVLDRSGDVLSEDAPTVPTFQFNSTKACGNNVQDSFATFRTVSKLVGRATNSLLSGASLQFYPFDIYYAQISLFAQINATGSSVGIITERPFGAPVNFNMKLNPQMSQNTAEGLFLHLDITRSFGVRVLAIIIVIANWLVTITFLWITVAAVIWPEEIVKDLFVIPIATLFAFASVRANLPGAPNGFGCFIDYLGILPNLALMTFCSAALLIRVLIQRISSLGSSGQTSTSVEDPPDTFDDTHKVLIAAVPHAAMASAVSLSLAPVPELPASSPQLSSPATSDGGPPPSNIPDTATDQPSPTQSQLQSTRPPAQQGK